MKPYHYYQTVSSFLSPDLFLNTGYCIRYFVMIYCICSQPDLRGMPMKFSNVYFVNGTAYAGKSTLVKLLAERNNGIACEENYHDALLNELDAVEFPNLCYTRDLADWHDFVRRTPEEYEAWIDGVTRECEALELRILDSLASSDRPIFVDTNIRPETLRNITATDHVLIMLADPEISVKRFSTVLTKKSSFFTA